MEKMEKNLNHQAFIGLRSQRSYGRIGGHSDGHGQTDSASDPNREYIYIGNRMVAL